MHGINDGDSLSSIEIGENTKKRYAGAAAGKRSGIKTDSEFEPPGDANVATLGKSYFSTSSIHQTEEELDPDGVLINDLSQHYGHQFDFVTKKKARPLKMRKKLYEFYAAPISKYICHLVSSILAQWAK